MILQLSNIGVKHDEWVLRDVNLGINKGEMIGVIGPSGIGKTTLLKTIAGLKEADEGEVLFHGKALIGPNEKLIPGYEDIQLVNQDFGLEPYHTVEQNVREKVLHLKKEDQILLVDELLSLVGLSKIKERKAIILSGGEQQRLSIARALACEPEVLLLDEPFVHLDQLMRLNIMKYISELNQLRGITVMIVSHDGAEMMGFVDKVVHVSGGGLKRFVSAQEMYYHPEDIEQGALLGYINSVQIDGEQVLFRPNEYILMSKKGIVVRFQKSIDNGMVVFNYFETDKGEMIMLTAMSEISDVKQIEIVKRG